ncbi:YggS family pyridoxal phosphate-dependent enzyme [Paenibacillus abyssi]|uniref:Pyridoxal phosphate homeostasis protein n=1 Tax=Paenibacillus abyssi TaxID=1340531 RepID=A0A917FVW4_9BACL|nr:YggS family pyridoxal phosphate-dependent enzyme [Paenibacillus abyssi]GGG10148.1 UPF0001 protein YlmE [Paenibacillus abyssi]
MTLTDRIENVELRLSEACMRSGRKRSDIGVIAVTKYVSITTAVDALKHGLVHLGENRWQDAEAKWRVISGGSDSAQPNGGSNGQAVWHFIGSLQTNKVKDVVGKFDYIHSLDRISLAQAIDKKAGQLGIQMPCFIQLNVSGENSKHGLPPEELASFVKQLAVLNHIKIAGLMTMAPYEAEPETTRPVFRGLRLLRDELNEKAILPYEVTGLSMGMSNDFEVAVEEGATWLRLGTVLVGKEEE